MSDSAAGELALTEAILHDVLILRYISAAGLTILLYDHLLSFADEVQLIWSAKLTSSKVLFLAMRYLVPGMMIAETIQLAGLSNVSLSNEFCKAWLTFAVLVGWVTIAINNWFVLLRVWVLWDRNRIFIISTLLFFIAMHATTLALAWIGVAHMINTLYFVPLFQLCGFSAFSDIGVVWIPELLFEFLMLMAMGWKVRMRPKTLKSLQEEGFGYFLFLFGLTLANTVVFLAARITLMFCLLFFMWCFTTTTTCSMILGLRRSAERARLIEAAASRDSRHAQFIELACIQRHDS